MNLLKEYRKEQRLNQQEMANLLNLNINTYRGYELGKRKVPYNVLARFLETRGEEDDIKLSKILKEIEE